MNFEKFYKSFGLTEYPFSTFTAENETNHAIELFVKPHDYSYVVESYKKKTSTIIIGERGTGKTALLNELKRLSNNKSELIISIDDYSCIDETHELRNIYNFFIKKISEEIFNSLIYEKQRMRCLSKDEKLFLSYLYKEHVSYITKEQLAGKINNIQKSALTKFCIFCYNKFRFLLNLGASAATNILNDTITKHLGGLPNIDSNQIKNFFPEASSRADDTYIEQGISYYQLEKILILVQSLGYSHTIIMLDKIDEDSRFKNDADRVSSFIEKTLSDNKLLLNDKLQVIISLWAVPYNFLKDRVRTQKHNCTTLSWDNKLLEEALNRRLQTFSKGKISTIQDLFTDDTNDSSIIFNLSNNNPRDLWHIMNNIVKAQYEIDPTKKLSSKSIEIGFENFVKKFNYYEYYPKKTSAKKNTMDVYGYIKHLLKLDSPEFTRDKLNTMAGTGSSTQNYCVSMEAIGLIKKTGSKSGAILYTINDPKVSYALEQGIDISRE
jgi:energy-coupling factor transporter ATP-binding protein EcfA2